MTTLHIVAVRDRAIDSYNQPVFVRALGEALRSFKDEINNPQSPMNKHPEDYDLYSMGYYDQEKGTFETQAPHQIAIGKDQIQAGE